MRSLGRICLVLFKYLVIHKFKLLLNALLFKTSNGGYPYNKRLYII